MPSTMKRKLENFGPEGPVKRHEADVSQLHGEHALKE